jgi:hypothetical protein
MTLDEMLSKLRGYGWSVAVHNDYRQDGESHTFWLFTRADRRWIKGEGRTDYDALQAALEDNDALQLKEIELHDPKT